MTWCVVFLLFFFLRKIKEGVVNKHPSTCSGVVFFCCLLSQWTVLSTLPQTAVPSLPAGRQT